MLAHINRATFYSHYSDKYELTTSSSFTEEILPFIMAGGYGERCEDLKRK